MLNVKAGGLLDICSPLSLRIEAVRAPSNFKAGKVFIDWKIFLLRWLSLYLWAEGSPKTRTSMLFSDRMLESS
jgi:hypothetical protein